MYRQIGSWQLTICSLHVAPVVVVRLLGFARPDELLLCCLWILVASWGCRGFGRSLWSLGFLALEGCVALVELHHRLLDLLFVFQLFIAIGAWTGLIAASFS